MDYGKATQPTYSAQELPVDFPLSDKDTQHLTKCAFEWAVDHGLYPKEDPELDSDIYVYRPGFTLVPSPFPRVLYRKALDLQPILHKLFWKVAQDHDFLVSALKR